MRNEISNSQDVIDSRDVIARISELASERDSLLEDIQTAKDELSEFVLPIPDGAEDEYQELTDKVEAANTLLTDWDEEYLSELKALQSLDEEAGSCGDWQHGEALIRDSHFRTYAENLAEELGMIKNDSQWPYTCINWEDAATELQSDYTSVEFDGVTYWIRS